MTCSFTVASFPVPAHFLSLAVRKSVIAMESWAGPGNEATFAECAVMLRSYPPQVGHAPSRRPPPAEIVDQDMDGDLQLLLKPYSPQFECQPGVSGTTLCLATTTLCCSPPVAAHGLGEGESTARRDAAVRLMGNLVTLGYKVA